MSLKRGTDNRESTVRGSAPQTFNVCFKLQIMGTFEKLDALKVFVLTAFLLSNDRNVSTFSKLRKMRNPLCFNCVKEFPVVLWKTRDFTLQLRVFSVKVSRKISKLCKPWASYICDLKILLEFKKKIEKKYFAYELLIDTFVICRSVALASAICYEITLQLQTALIVPMTDKWCCKDFITRSLREIM